MKHETGNVHYTCGHVVWDKDMPQDQDWQSEVECPACRSNREAIWKMRTDRLAKLLSVNAPRHVIEQEMLLDLKTYGLWRLIFRDLWGKVQLNFWWLWHRVILGKSFEQIEDEILRRKE